MTKKELVKDMTDLEKLRLLDILLKEFDILDYVNEIQFDVELDDDDRSLVNKILNERWYKVFEDKKQRRKQKMTREDKYKLIELLEGYRNERILELARDYNLTEREIRAKLCREPEEVYEMDDGDRFLEGIDIVLSVLD